MNRFPSHSDVRAVWGSGPEGASLANRWMDAMIAASFAASQGTPAALFDRRPALLRFVK
jgi:hypothetical protein